MDDESSDSPLQKKDVEVGFVLWLPKAYDARNLDREAYRRSGLREGACDHPVLLIDKLDDSHDLVWISIMTSKHNPRYASMAVKVEGCRENHRADETDCKLFHVHDATCMDKPGLVGVSSAFEVSVAMLRKDVKEPYLGCHRLDDRSVVLVKAEAITALNELELTSHALKICPRPPPPRFNNLSRPVPDFDPNAGYTTGMLPLVSTPHSSSASIQSSRSGSPDSSELTRNSANTSETSLSSHPGPDATSADAVLTRPPQLASHSNKGPEPSRTERMATKPMAKAPEIPSTGTDTVHGLLAGEFSNMYAKKDAVSKTVFTQSTAVTIQVTSTAAIKGDEPSNSRELDSGRSKQAATAKQSTVNNTSPASDEGSVGRQQIAKLPASRSLGMSHSTTSARPTESARVTHLQGAKQIEGTLASDQARAPRSIAPSSQVAEAQPRSANSAPKRICASNTISARPVPVEITVFESAMTPTLAASSLASGSVEQATPDSTITQGPGSILASPDSSKSIGATPYINKSSTMAMEAKVKVAEARVDDRSTTRTTLKTHQAAPSPAASPAAEFKPRASGARSFLAFWATKLGNGKRNTQEL